MSKAQSTPATSFELTSEDKLFLSNAFKVHAKPSNDLMGLYFVSGMLLPSIRDKAESLLEGMFENGITHDQFVVSKSQYNGKLFAKKVCRV